jgi:hypothetical protein
MIHVVLFFLVYNFKGLLNFCREIILLHCKVNTRLVSLQILSKNKLGQGIFQVSGNQCIVIFTTEILGQENLGHYKSAKKGCF